MVSKQQEIHPKELQLTNFSKYGDSFLEQSKCVGCIHSVTVLWCHLSSQSHVSWLDLKSLIISANWQHTHNLLTQAIKNNLVSVTTSSSYLALKAFKMRSWCSPRQQHSPLTWEAHNNLQLGAIKTSFQIFSSSTSIGSVRLILSMSTLSSSIMISMWICIVTSLLFTVATVYAADINGMYLHVHMIAVLDACMHIRTNVSFIAYL